MKFKILLVSAVPPPVGGIATWSNIIINYYLLNPSKFCICLQNTANFYREISDVRFLSRFISGIKTSFIIIKEFKRNLSKEKPNIIHLTSSASFALFKDVILLYIASRNKIPVVTHFHFGRIPELILKKNWEWYLLSRVIKLSNKVIVIDRRSFVVLTEFGFYNIKNIPNPISIELEEKAKIKSINVLNENKYNVVFVGHVVENKGVFELVKSCLSLSEIKELTIIGPYENDIKDKLIKLAKIKDDGKWIKFKGVLNKNEVYEELEKASLLALPSYTEGFPNVILESMAFACPVVATNVGAIPEMLDVLSHNPSGICVNVKNIDELTDAIFSLITDAKKAKIMGVNGNNKLLNNYTVSIISNLYEAVWFDVLK